MNAAVAIRIASTTKPRSVGLASVKVAGSVSERALLEALEPEERETLLKLLDKLAAKSVDAERVL